MQRAEPGDTLAWSFQDKRTGLCGCIADISEIKVTLKPCNNDDVKI